MHYLCTLSLIIFTVMNIFSHSHNYHRTYALNLDVSALCMMLRWCIIQAIKNPLKFTCRWTAPTTSTRKVHHSKQTSQNTKRDYWSRYNHVKFVETYCRILGCVMHAHLGEFGIVFKAQLLDWYEDIKQLTVAVKALKCREYKCMLVVVCFSRKEIFWDRCQYRVWRGEDAGRDCKDGEPQASKCDASYWCMHWWIPRNVYRYAIHAQWKPPWLPKERKREPLSKQKG